MPGNPRFAVLTSAALLPLALGCNRADDPRFTRSAPRPEGAPKLTHIREPDKLTSIESGQLDPLGQPIRVACESCHSQKKSETLPASSAELKEFHQTLRVEHGTLTCGQCHQPGKATSLRLADGRLVAMTDVMQLCGQCHGPQLRDYGKGAHGGMQGYWDRTRGERVRNNCVDCHDPHVPKYQPGRPVLPPRDRGLVKGGGHG